MSKSDIILSIENVSKHYQLGAFGTKTISGDVNRWWQKVRGKEDSYLKIGATNDRTSKEKLFNNENIIIRLNIKDENDNTVFSFLSDEMHCDLKH